MRSGSKTISRGAACPGWFRWFGLSFFPPVYPTLVEMTPSRRRSSSWTPQKQPPARIAVSVLSLIVISSCASEIGRLRDLWGWGADDDRDLSVVGQLDRARVPGVGLAVDVERDRLRTAVPPDARIAETHAPLGEELAERVGLGGRRLGMEDAGPVVGVEG